MDDQRPADRRLGSVDAPARLTPAARTVWRHPRPKRDRCGGQAGRAHRTNAPLRRYALMTDATGAPITPPPRTSSAP